MTIMHHLTSHQWRMAYQSLGQDYVADYTAMIVIAVSFVTFALNHPYHRFRSHHHHHQKLSSSSSSKIINIICVRESQVASTCGQIDPLLFSFLRMADSSCAIRSRTSPSNACGVKPPSPLCCWGYENRRAAAVDGWFLSLDVVWFCW